MDPEFEPASTGRAELMSSTRRCLARAAVLLLPAGLLAGAADAPAQEGYDVVIRDARVLDGMGNPWTRADVALRGDRIAAVGSLDDADAGRIIDAGGLYLAPGFIDVHSHAGRGLDDPGLGGARPIVTQGITTVFVNPDGGGAVDLARQRRAFLEHGLGVNVAQQVPHGSVRREVLGMDDRAPDDEELSRMKELVRAGMEEGAFGLSSGPFYAPGSYATTGELVELARVASEYGGTYSSHIRDESDYTIGLVAAVEEVITVAREADLPGIVTHIKALGPHVWGYSAAVEHRVERARARGVQVYADQYPYPASATGLSAALVPRWAEEGGDDSLRARLRDPETRERIRRAMVENLERRGGPGRIQFRRHEPDPSIEGRTLADVAGERDLHPVEAAMELIAAGGAGIVSFNMHPDDVARFMRQPWTMTCTDGGLVPMGEGVPHPRNYGAFPRKLREYVREEGVIGLEHAIRSMTSLPAAVFGMRDRGVIREGAIADVVVFDLEAVRDRATFQDPHQLSEGMVHVFVNGEPAIADGEITGGLHGKVLSRTGADRGRTE